MRFDKSYAELKEMFKALKKAKEILGKKMWEKIRRRLVEGSKATRETEYLQGLRRGAAARSLGMTGDKYERFLGGEETAMKELDESINTTE